MKNKKIFFNLIAIQILFWFGWQFATYQIVYLQSVGMSTKDIGVMSAVCSLASMVASIFWGWISDKINSIKKAFILNLIITTLFIVALPLLPTKIKYASVMFIVYRVISCFSQGPIATLLDNHAVRNCEEHGLNFGILTAFRFISGTLGGLLCTLVLTRIEVKYAFLIFGLFMIPTLICVLMSNDPQGYVNEKKDGEHTRHENVLLGLGNYRFIVFLAFTLFFNLAHQAVTIFIPSFMSDIGVDSANWGIYNSVRLLTSIPFMFMFGWIRKRMKLETVIILSCVFMSMESLLLGLFEGNLAWILVCGAIYGVGGGLFTGAVPLYILKLAPDNLKATAHNVYGAVCLGAGIVGNLLGGMLYDAMGGSSFYVLLGTIMLLSVVFFIASFMFGNKHKTQNGADAA